MFLSKSIILNGIDSVHAYSKHHLANFVSEYYYVGSALKDISDAPKVRYISASYIYFLAPFAGNFLVTTVIMCYQI